MLGCFYSFVHAETEDRTKDNTQDFNFVAASDFGCDDEPNRTIERMIKEDPDIVIALG